jgi:acetyltransferase-like isoleucine patch superfamily enzyme
MSNTALTVKPLPRDPRAFARKAFHYALKRLLAPIALRHCTEVGAGARVRGFPVVENEGGTIRIGRNFCVFSYLAKVQLYAGPGAVLAIGDDTFVNNGTTLSASCAITIGSRVNIAPHCTLIDNDFHAVDQRDAAPKMAPIVLEDDVWLGTRVTVLKGVTIGQGSVIAAGAVVTKDIPPGVLAGGVPAKVLRKLT